MRKLMWLLLAVALAGLAGCAQFAWVKDGASQQEANRDTRTCLKKAQQSDSRTHVSMYGGFAQDSVISDPNMYHACMAAHGYSWRQVRAGDDDR